MELFLKRSISLVVNFGKSEYRSLDAVNKAVKRFFYRIILKRLVKEATNKKIEYMKHVFAVH